MGVKQLKSYESLKFQKWVKFCTLTWRVITEPVTISMYQKFLYFKPRVSYNIDKN